MRRYFVLLIAMIPFALAGGCSSARDRAPDGAAGPGPSATTHSTTSASPPAVVPSGPVGPGGLAGPIGSAAAVPPAQGNYRTTYGWGVPSNQVRVPHPDVQLPLPGPPLPYLVMIGVGELSEGGRAFSRISFSFRGEFPEYNFQYVPEVLSEGEGTPVRLEGNSFLRIQFVHAQAHNNDTRSTLTSAPDRHIGHPTLRSYAPGGDFEGYVTYGLGIQTAPNSDQVLPIRVSEARLSEASSPLYTIMFDVSR